MRRINIDIVTGGATLVGALILFQQTFLVRNFPGVRFGAEIWPRFVIAIVAVLAVIQLLQGIRGGNLPRRQPTEEGEVDRTERGFTSGDAIAIAIFVSFAIFVYLLPILGTPLAGFLLVFGILSLIGEIKPRAILRHVVIAGGAVALMWVIFTYVLRVILPAGLWASWF